MMRLRNSNGGLSASAMRALLTGAVRPIITWGAELRNRTNRQLNLEKMRRLEYQDHRSVLWASHQKLGWIAAVEPLQSRLYHILICWAARSLRTGDKAIQSFLEDTLSQGYTAWRDGTGRAGLKTDGSILAAFALTPIMNPEEASYEIFRIRRKSRLIAPQDERSKSTGYWAGTIGGRLTLDVLLRGHRRHTTNSYSGEHLLSLTVNTS